MRKLITRLTALLLASVTATTMLACSNDGGETTDTTAVSNQAAEETTTAAETDYIDTLDQYDMEGRAFTIIAQNTSGRQNFYMEEKEGDLINDAIHERDMAIEERLNIKLDLIQNSDRLEVTNMVQRTLQAGDEAYNMVINALSAGINTLTVNEMLLDLNELPYLTLDEVWWNKSISERMLFGGKQYFTTGPISGVYYLTPIVMMFNKKLVEDYNLGDIYQIVLDGKWTVDKLAELALDKSYDVNNDGYMTRDDFWGLVIDGTFGNALYVGAGLDTVEQVDGRYELTLDSEESINVIEKCGALFGDRNAVINDANGQLSYATKIFDVDRAIFMDYTISGVMGRRSMESDFGVIPCPKLNETQDEYYTTCNTFLPGGVAVPFICSDTDFVGLVMETMAYLSYKIMQPAVYETTLQGKVARDDISVQMLDMIFESATFDFVTVFNFAGISTTLRIAVTGDNKNFMSAYAAVKDKAQLELEKIMEFSE